MRASGEGFNVFYGSTASMITFQTDTSRADTFQTGICEPSRNLVRRCSALRIVVACLATVLVLACASCSGRGNNEEPIYPVVGKVTYNGAPASGAVVYFRNKSHDERTQPAIMGFVQKDGSFEMVTGPLGKGAPAGDYDVLIEWKRVTGYGVRRPQTRPDLLQGRFDDPKRPLFHAKIEAGRNKLPPFELSTPALG